MEFIEKTCPKCGANLEFNLGDKEVKCSYCNKTYVIKDNDNKVSNTNNIDLNSDEVKEGLKLVAKVGVGTYIISILIFIGVIFVFGLVFYNISHLISSQVEGFKSDFSDSVEEENDDNIEEEDNILKSISDISESDRQKIQERSLIKLKEWNEKDSVSLNNYKDLGYYLIYDEYGTDLYDIYELNYNVKGQNYTIYTGVKYNDVNYKNKEVKVDNGSIFGTIIATNWSSLWGYNSVKDLYNNLNFKDATLVASDGLYKN